MSKQKKPRKGQTKTLGDVTINDFANSSAPKHRPKKSSTSVTTIIKQLEDHENQTQSKSWDDQELDDYDYIKQENDDGEVIYVLKKVKIVNLNTTDVAESTIDTGKDYPVDIWFLISEYIKPEDIGTFARICRTSYSITNTGKFWFSLYKRYYKKTVELPRRLQPDCMFRLYGIRMLVIKSLYYTYPLFVNQLKVIKTEEHPDVLTKRMCTLMWHVKFKNHWVYYFKLKEMVYPPHLISNRDEKRVDLIELLEDVAANVEENCRVLQITCLSFIPVLSVQGLFLTSVGVTLSQGFRHNRVQLIFNTNLMHGKSTTEGTVCILLDPVINVRILDWWHPLYPHNYNLNLLVNQNLKEIEY